MEKEWKPLTLFLVEYQAGDPIGCLLACISLLPILIFVGMITLIIFRRDLHTICYLVGCLMSECVNLIVKNIFKHERPPSRGRYPLKSYAMPSDHAQFMWFIVSYFLLFLFIRLHKNYSFVDDIWRYLVAFTSVLSGVLVNYSRVYLGYHTWDQVLWGTLVGVVLGFLWFFVVHICLSNYFSLITNSMIGEYLMLRDSTLIPNVLWFEYIYTRNEARLRGRKNHSGKH